MKFTLFALICFFSCAAFADLKFTNRVTTQGHTAQTTTLVKQGKIRVNAGTTPDGLTIIFDCVGNRMIQVNARARTYFTTPLDSSLNAPVSNGSSNDSGIVNLHVEEQDTGERKSLFGYSARHIKGTVTAEAGAGACSKNFSLTTDGWYIDAPATQACASASRELILNRLRQPGCHDHFVAKHTGVEDPGFPIMVDAELSTDNGMKIGIHQEGSDLATTTLDPALFEIPAGYTQVHSYRDLTATQNSTVGAQSGLPSGLNFPPVAGPNGNGKGVIAGATHAAPVSTGPLKIGITQITSGVDQTLSVEGLQQELMNQINFLGGKAVLIPADPNDRDAANEQAKQQGCDYVIFTELTNFKTASVGQKLGSVLNRGGLGGVGGTGHGRVELSANVKVFQPDVFTPVLDGTSDFRGNDADNTAKGLMHTEARTVMLELRKLHAPKQ